LVIPQFPGQIAVTQADGVVEDGIFFLDFSRPLEQVKGRFGIVSAVLVPVRHQSQGMGEFVIAVGRGDHYYKDITGYWKSHFPADLPAPVGEFDGLKVVADFARQFPEAAAPAP
jgi:hypothetical protein